MLVDFIIPTFNRHAPLKSMIASLVAQTNPGWGAHVVIDNPDDVENVKIVESFNDPRIRWSKMERRYNDWGHTPREFGKQKSEAKYIIMTGDDNYYTPNFVQELASVITHNPGIVYWDMVHSHYNYSCFKCKLVINEIDMGAFAVRRDLAQTLPLDKSFAADGEYVRNFLKKFSSEGSVKINKTLFVHN
jgi:glycosyltransferase involved in cell wall biosynthesis